jgi:hypothetical protein
VPQLRLTSRCAPHKCFVANALKGRGWEGLQVEYFVRDLIAFLNLFSPILCQTYISHAASQLTRKP